MQATPTSAARVLGIPELAGLCCEQLQNAHSLKSLGSLAVTSRTLEEIASKYLWARLPTLLPLMLTLPEVKVWNHPQHVITTAMADILLIANVHIVAQ